MNHRDFEDLDDFIESALKDERMRNVPFGFQRKVEDNLRVAAAIQAERNKYRLAMIVGVTIYTLIFGSATLYMVLGAIFSSISESLPGFLSYYAQLSQTVEIWWVELAAFTGLLTVVGVWTLMHLNARPSEEA